MQNVPFQSVLLYYRRITSDGNSILLLSLAEAQWYYFIYMRS